jgi:hypothetical protein
MQATYQCEQNITAFGTGLSWTMHGNIRTKNIQPNKHTQLKWDFLCPAGVLEKHLLSKWHFVIYRQTPLHESPTPISHIYRVKFEEMDIRAGGCMCACARAHTHTHRYSMRVKLSIHGSYMFQQKRVSILHAATISHLLPHLQVWCTLTIT